MGIRANTMRVLRGHTGAMALGAGAMGAASAVGMKALRTRHEDQLSMEALRQAGRGGAVRRVIASDGVGLSVEVDGFEDAPLTVVFAHGWTLDLSMWRAQREALAGSGARLVFYDQRGHGLSERGPVGATISLRRLGEDLHAVLEAVAPRGPVVLVGHSMGGAAVLALAGARPELFGPRIKAVCLVSAAAGAWNTVTLGLPRKVAHEVQVHAPTVLRLLGGQPALIHGAGMTPYVLFARQFLCDRTASLENLRTCAALISAAQLDVVAEFLPVLQKGDESASLPVIGRVPTLIIAGARDRLTPLSHTTALTRGIPKSRLIRIPDCGHMAPMEKPEIVNRHLAEMIAGAHQAASPAGHDPAAQSVQGSGQA